MKAYTWKTGGAHRNTRQARQWRALTANITETIRRVHPEIDGGLLRAMVRDQACSTARRVGEAEVARTMEGVYGGERNES